MASAAKLVRQPTEIGEEIYTINNNVETILIFYLHDSALSLRISLSAMPDFISVYSEVISVREAKFLKGLRAARRPLGNCMVRLTANLQRNL